MRIFTYEHSSCDVAGGIENAQGALKEPLSADALAACIGTQRHFPPCCILLAV